MKKERGSNSKPVTFPPPPPPPQKKTRQKEAKLIKKNGRVYG